MHYVVFCQDFKSLEQLPEAVNYELQRHHPRCVAFVVLDEFPEGPSVTVLIHEVVVIGGLQHVDVADDVRASLDAGKGVDFINCALLQFGDFFELLRFDNFNGHLLASYHMEAFVYLPIHSFPNQFLQGVVLYYFTHLDFLELIELGMQ